MLPVIAAAAGIAGMGVIIYRNWEPIKAFFVDNFETIRNTLMFVFPPLGLLVGFAGVIRDNWEGIKEFFSTLWETVKLAFQVAFEGDSVYRPECTGWDSGCVVVDHRVFRGAVVRDSWVFPRHAARPCL